MAMKYEQESPMYYWYVRDRIGQTRASGYCYKKDVNNLRREYKDLYLYYTDASDDQGVAELIQNTQ